MKSENIENADKCNFKRKLGKLIDLNTKCEKDILQASKWYHKNSNLWKLLARLKHRKNRKKYNIEIYPECDFRGGITIPHAVGIVIGRTAKIGNNTKIMPNVVIGAKYSSKAPNPDNDKRRHAIIGDNCMLGAGCKIIGDIIIGDNVTIGANAVVTKDVPSNCTVVGVNKILRNIEGDNYGSKEI